MTDDEMIERVRELRARNLSPKGIARSLGVRPAVVADLVRELAAERDGDDGRAEVIECWLNAGWSAGLSIRGHPEWLDRSRDVSAEGLVTALVSRRPRHRRRRVACLYLVDVYCLGVKNAMGPDEMGDRAFQRFSALAFSAYRGARVAAPIELARDLVLGAVEYARGLGFAPHPDFDQARAHLGQWEPPSAITFGRGGKPTYVSGPYDDPLHVLRTLRRAVGRDGFHYSLALDGDELRMTD